MIPRNALVAAFLIALPAPAFAADAITLRAQVSEAAPYQGQTIRYSVSCYLRSNVSYASLAQLTVPNAVVEREGDPETSDILEGGRPVRVVTFHYLITPLQPGRIVVPPAVLEGMADRAAPVTGSLFPSYNNAQAVSIRSNAVAIDVKPPAADMTPWLPLTALSLAEDWDNAQMPRVGEPLIRSITLTASGMAGSQLPDLSAQQDHVNFRIYADKATSGMEVAKDTGAITGWRRENYSLIPLKAGPLTLPAITVSWWDIAGNTQREASIPERVIEVQPGAPAPVSLLPSGTAVLYGAIGLLAAAAAGAAAWAFTLRRALHRMKEGTPVPRAKRSARASMPKIPTAIRTPEELKSFLQSFAHAQWGVSPNAPLESMLTRLPRHWNNAQRQEAESLIGDLSAALYAGRASDVATLNSRAQRLLAALKRDAGGVRVPEEKLAKLNPS